ncbi:MAG: pimeloyl-ACP methyl ester carboxylesterase [Acidimicrobiales bacterium]|jgi:pimeloyl-ACP methyl ester carboxylesterase
MTTFVLLHGAYQGGWIWKHVGERLTAAGHQVYRPSLDGCGDRRQHLRPGITTETHGAEIAALLVAEDLTDVAMVGTSSGGMVLCRAAELVPERVGRVSFVDALALFSGEKLGDIVQRSSALSDDLATSPPKEDIATRLFGDLEPEVRDWALDRTTPHPIAALNEPITLASFWDAAWAAQVIYCNQSSNPPVAHQRRTAEALNASWHELDTGHYPMLSMPDELSHLLQS